MREACVVGIEGVSGVGGRAAVCGAFAASGDKCDAPDLRMPICDPYGYAKVQ